MVHKINILYSKFSEAFWWRIAFFSSLFTIILNNYQDIFLKFYFSFFIESHSDVQQNEDEIVIFGWIVCLKHVFTTYFSVICQWKLNLHSLSVACCLVLHKKMF